MATLAYAQKKLAKIAPLKKEGNYWTSRLNGKVMDILSVNGGDSIIIGVRALSNPTDEGDWINFDNLNQALRFMGGR